MLTSGQDNGRRWVRFSRNPATVESVENEQSGNQANDNHGDLLFDRVVVGISTANLLVGANSAEVLHVGGENSGHTDAGQDAGNWSQDQHETDHDTGEVHAGHTVQDDEDVGIGQSTEAVVETDGEHERQKLQIKVERRPGSRLMFRYGSDDRDVVLGVAGVEQGVETSGPGCNLARQGEDSNCNGQNGADGDGKHLEEEVELRRRQLGANVVDEGVDLAESKHSQSSHMLTRLHRLETDEGDLHGENGTQHIDSAVRHVHAVREATGEHQSKHVHRDQVDQEDVSSPWRDHVEVADGAQSCPEDRASLHCLDPEPVGVQHAEDGNSFVIVRSSHRSGDVARDDSDESRSRQTGSGVLQFLGEVEGYQRGQRWKQRCNIDTHITNFNGNVQEVHNMVDNGCGHHQTGVDRATDDSSQGVPSTIVEPVVEAVKSFLRQIASCPVVEVRIELVNDVLESENGEQSQGESKNATASEDGHLQQGLLLLQGHASETNPG